MKKTAKSFSVRVIELVLSIVRVRLFLISSNKSKLDLYDQANFVKYSFDNISGEIPTAKLLNKNEHMIRQLMPGSACKGVAKRIEKFNQLLIEAQNILADAV